MKSHRRTWIHVLLITSALALLAVNLQYTKSMFQYVPMVHQVLDRRRDVLLSFIGDKNGSFKPTIEHLNSFIRSFRRFNQDARIVLFMTDNHRTGKMKVFDVLLLIISIFNQKRGWFLNVI